MSEYSILHRLLARVFIEIRATSKLKKAQGLADIVHNVPAQIERGVPSAEILSCVRLRAERTGAAEVIDGYIRAAATPGTNVHMRRLEDLDAGEDG